ncbi:MAG: xanthine dehydrogenase family protein molybdopterin-binding subunit, partial [Pseudonocardia sp.]
MTDRTARLMGAAIPRREDERLLDGRGSFLADLARGAHHVVFVRSDVAHAEITGIATAAALQVPGVVDVVTAPRCGLVTDHIAPLHSPDPAFSAATAFTMAEQRLAIMAATRVHHVGQIVAAVVAVDRYVAED